MTLARQGEGGHDEKKLEEVVRESWRQRRCGIDDDHVHYNSVVYDNVRGDFIRRANHVAPGDKWAFRSEEAVGSRNVGGRNLGSSAEWRRNECAFGKRPSARIPPAMQSKADLRSPASTAVQLHRSG